LKGENLGNGIIATFSPRVAFGNSFKGQIKSFKDPVATKSFESIVGTGRGESTAWRQKGGDQILITFDKEDKRKNQNLSQHFSN
jgi:hypothetical protein